MVLLLKLKETIFLSKNIMSNFFSFTFKFPDQMIIVELLLLGMVIKTIELNLLGTSRDDCFWKVERKEEIL